MHDIVAAIKQGEEASFEDAYKMHRARIYGYLLKKTASQEDAKDLMQMVFLRLWEYRHTLNQEYTLEQHLFSIARSVFVNYIYKENRKAAFKRSAGITASENTAENDTTSLFDMHEKLESILNGMPSMRKEVFILTRLKGYSYKQVSEILSISIKSVDNHLSKALRQIRSKYLLLILLSISFFEVGSVIKY